MSQRERILLFCIVAVLAALFVDRYALTPLLQQQDQLDFERGQMTTELRHIQELQRQRKDRMANWQTRIDSGLKNDPAEAESQVLHALDDWSKETGCVLSSLKSDRLESKDQIKEIQIQLSGSGSMSGIAQLLWKMHTAQFPLKIVELQLASRADNTTDVTIQAKLSTLHLSPVPANGERKVK